MTAKNLQLIRQVLTDGVWSEVVALPNVLMRQARLANDHAPTKAAISAQLERPINKLLKPVIDRYIDQHRPVLARSDATSSALWFSSHGTPMTAQRLTDVITKATLSTVGVAVSPHLFRTSAASTVAAHGGDNPFLGSALLHHTDPRVTITHYNRATAFSAGESFRTVVRQYEKG